MRERAPLATRVARAGDWPAVSRLLAAAFLSGEDTVAGAEPFLYEPERGLLVTAGDALAAHTAAYTRELAVPGAVIPAAHVALVAVAAAHRRQGLLSRLMRRQLADIRTGGREPIAMLWASEGRIYGRYGYGLAATRLSLATDTRDVCLPGTPPEGYWLDEVTPEEGLAQMRAVYAGLWPQRTGWSSRSDTWWQRAVGDRPEHRYGATPLRALLAVGPAGTSGYALWRATGEWDDLGPTGSAEVRELVAATPEALRALWRFLFSLDLTRQLQYPLAAADDPVVHLVDEPRRLRGTLCDGQWIRLADVPAALAARRYRVPVDVTIEVGDALLPGNAGVWRLSGDRSGAVCERTSAPAELAADVRALGAAYLGGTSLATLAAAGQVTELRGGALAAASDAFGWHRLPSAVEMF